MLKTIVIAGLTLAVGATAAFAGPPLTKDEALKLMAQPGSWLEADGSLFPDGTLNGKDFEIVAATDADETEEPAIYGAVTMLNRAKSTMRVLDYTVTWDAMTTLKDENKRKILSSKIEEGMPVKIQGSLAPNGTFKATKIKLQTAKVKDGKVKAKEKVFGPVSIEARSGKIRVLNTLIALREDATFIKAIPNAAPAATP